MSLKVLKRKVAHEGRIIRVIESKMSDGRVFEQATRSPGTRIIIYDKEKDQVLLSKEFRREIDSYDYRLPGGKVRNDIKGWDKIKKRAKLIDLIAEACKKEAREETGIELNDLKLFTILTSGGPTIEWTLYYFFSTKFTVLGKQELEAEEEITTKWLSSSEAIEICLSGKMKEGRSAAALLQFFYSEGKI